MHRCEECRNEWIGLRWRDKLRRRTESICVAKASMSPKHALTRRGVFSWGGASIWQQVSRTDWKIHCGASTFRLSVAMKARVHWRLVLWLIRQRHRCPTDISVLPSHVAVSLAQYLCDLAVGGPEDVPMKWERREMVEKSRNRKAERSMLGIERADRFRGHTSM